MYSSEKPFSCDVDGCSMKFVVEDRLIVHKKRHEMLLNLGQGHKGGLFADQTPTPTRFIRNCEEVGLFQDLQNVNPFEETFRKAAELVKTGETPSLQFTRNTPDDTLHTPNVFPNITDVHVALPLQHSAPVISHETLDVNNKNLNDTIYSQSKALVPENSTHLPTIQHNTASCQKVDTEDINNHVENSVESKAEDVGKVQVVMKIPGGRTVQFFANEISNDKIEEMKPNTVLLNAAHNETNVKYLLKEKLKENASIKLLEQKSEVTKIPIPKVHMSGIRSLQPRPGTMRNFTSFSSFPTFNMNSATQNKTPSGIIKSKSRPRRKTVNYVKETRNEFLARNRAAATRSREKKKLYLKHMEKVNEDLKLSNRYLNLVNMSLIEEMQKLKKILLQHVNCSLSTIKPHHADEINSLVNSVPTIVIGNEVNRITDIPSSEFMNCLANSFFSKNSNTSSIMDAPGLSEDDDDVQKISNLGVNMLQLEENINGSEILPDESVCSNGENDNINVNIYDNCLIDSIDNFAEVTLTDESVSVNKEVECCTSSFEKLECSKLQEVELNTVNRSADPTVLREHSYCQNSFHFFAKFGPFNNDTVIKPLMTNTVYSQNTKGRNTYTPSVKLENEYEDRNDHSSLQNDVCITNDSVVLASDNATLLLKPFKKRSINDLDLLTSSAKCVSEQNL